MADISEITWSGIILTFVISALCSLAMSAVLYFDVRRTQRATDKKQCAYVQSSIFLWGAGLVLVRIMLPLSGTVTIASITACVAALGCFVFVPFAYFFGAHKYNGNRRRYLRFIASAIQMEVLALFAQSYAPLTRMSHMLVLGWLFSWAAVVALGACELEILARNCWKFPTEELK